MCSTPFVMRVYACQLRFVYVVVVVVVFVFFFQAEDGIRDSDM